MTKKIRNEIINKYDGCGALLALCLLFLVVCFILFVGVICAYISSENPHVQSIGMFVCAGVSIIFYIFMEMDIRYIYKRDYKPEEIKIPTIKLSDYDDTIEMLSQSEILWKIYDKN
jgi:hypothetical protein